MYCQLWCFLLVTTQWWQYHSKQVSLLHSSCNIIADQLLWYTVVAILQQAGDSVTRTEIDSVILVFHFSKNMNDTSSTQRVYEMLHLYLHSLL